MYLLLFVTLIIGMLGVYAQVLSLQAARLASLQSSLATTMVAWHDAAISMGASILNTNPPALTLPCSLTYTGGITSCLAPTGSGAASGTVTDVNNNPNNIFNVKTGQAEPVHLPANYTASLYQFYSVLYRDAASNQPYVVTFVSPPVISATNPAPGFLSLPPTGAMTSFTMSDLVHQLYVSGLPPYAYGTIRNNGSTLATTMYQYSIPGAAGLPNGAEAIISSPAGF